MKSAFEAMGGTYRQCGDYLIPDISLGSFAEYPADIAIKVRYDGSEVDDIYQAICLLTSRSGAEMGSRSKKARKYAEENCDLGKNAEMYSQFFKQFISGTWQPDYCDVMIGRLCELGLIEDSYTERMGRLLESLGLL